MKESGTEWKHKDGDMMSLRYWQCLIPTDSPMCFPTWSYEKPNKWWLQMNYPYVPVVFPRSQMMLPMTDRVVRRKEKQNP